MYDIHAVLEAAGSSMLNVVKTTVLMKDIADYKEASSKFSK